MARLSTNLWTCVLIVITMRWLTDTRMAFETGSSEQSSSSSSSSSPANDNSTTSIDTQAFEQCVSKSGYNFKDWDPNKDNSKIFRWHFMSTVGTSFTHVRGIATHCDWVVGVRPIETWYTDEHRVHGYMDRVPQTIFLNVDEQQKFHDDLLPCFPPHSRFVIITGDHDRTTPQQVDKRYLPALQPGTWESLLDDQRVLHLFVEHLDTPAPSDRVTPIPLGLNPFEFDGHNADLALQYAVNHTTTDTVVPISQRPLKMIFTNRVRKGPQWNDRKQAMSICQHLPHCDIQNRLVGQAAFMRTIQNFPFLLCVHGGGVDPNPNLFQALLAGVIPIMGPFAGQTMYKDLPVVIADGNWNDVNSTFLSRAYLRDKLEELAPYFENAEKRAQVLEKLTLQYWWNKVETVLEANRAM